MRTFVVGTRGSALALWQTRWVSLLTHRAITERIITTRGDLDQSSKLQGKLEKGFFTEELEAALYAKEIDWAVHSLKDLPTRQPDGLVLGAIVERASPADLLLVRNEYVDESRAFPVKPGARVGTCSLRREAMLRHVAPEAVATPLRGNVPTRLTKLRDHLYDAIVLAEAGVRRLQLDLTGLAVFRLDPRRWPPAPGQGAVAVQCRADDEEVRAVLRGLHHVPTAHAVEIEREFLRTLEGGCTTPFGCYVDGQRAWLGQLHGDTWREKTTPVPLATPGPEWFSAELASFPRQESSHEPLFTRV
ncbi:MAG: hydroxymethylbilane synthase [Myxococcaceae bacterium]